MIKTLLFSLVLALASYAMFQPKVSAETIELVPASPVVVEIFSGTAPDERARRVREFD